SSPKGDKGSALDPALPDVLFHETEAPPHSVPAIGQGGDPKAPRADAESRRFGDRAASECRSRSDPLLVPARGARAPSIYPSSIGTRNGCGILLLPATVAMHHATCNNEPHSDGFPGSTGV